MHLALLYYNNILIRVMKSCFYVTIVTVLLITYLTAFLSSILVINNQCDDLIQINDPLPPMCILIGKINI